MDEESKDVPALARIDESRIIPSFGTHRQASLSYCYGRHKFGPRPIKVAAFGCHMPSVHSRNIDALSLPVLLCLSQRAL